MTRYSVYLDCSYQYNVEAENEVIAQDIAAMAPLGAWEMVDVKSEAVEWPEEEECPPTPEAPT